MLASLVIAAAGAATASAQGVPELSAWIQNFGDWRGSSANATLNTALRAIQADVQQVRYSATNAYINATGVPDYNIGPWAGSPNTAANQNTLARIPRSPQPQNGAKTATGLGAIGLMIDGTQIYNASDARSYQNRNVWHQNAEIAEAGSFELAGGHPSPGNAYHYHGQPRTLRARIGDDGSRHSPIIGFAFDGFPIYGSYGYANANGTGGVVRMVSSYRTRAITQRTTLPNGTVLAATNYGPAVSTTFPIGFYLEDWEFVASSGPGALDQYNGRFEVTPEYPAGTYAYHITINADGTSAYPFIIGPSYYGVVATDNTNRSVTVPATGVDRYYPCPADYNQDGGVDGDDIAPFFTDWSNGADRADVNYDGGVDGSDVAAFFAIWSSGGC
jgi:hypothetical protein